MWMSRTVFFLAFAFTAMAMSMRDDFKVSETYPIDDKFLNDELTDKFTVTQDLQEPASTLPKQKTMVDAMLEISAAKYNVLKSIKENEDRILNAIVNLDLGHLEAIRAAKIACLKIMAGKIMNMVEELPSDKLNALLQSPLFDLAADMLLPILSEISTPNVQLGNKH